MPGLTSIEGSEPGMLSMFENPSELIARMSLILVSPSPVQDLLLPLVLFIVVEIAKSFARYPLDEYQPLALRASVAWCLSLPWRAVQFPPWGQLQADLRQLFDDFIPIPVQAVFTILAVILHYYVLLSLMIVLIRFYWRPMVPFLSTRAYPILMMSIPLPFAAALYLKINLDLGPRVLPSWYLYFALLIFVSLALIRRR